MDKVKTFEKELSYIKNPQIKLFAEKAIESLPEYFFEIGASSSNKYHPNYASGNGGLSRHTIAATRIAIELFRTDLWEFTDDEKDLILVGLMLHDGFKLGKNHEQYTQAKHPLMVVFELSQDDKLKTMISPEQFEFMAGNISSHMGKWNYTYNTKEVVLPKPKTVSQRFTHLCDYLASRKCLEFNFDAELSKE